MVCLLIEKKILQKFAGFGYHSFLSSVQIYLPSYKSLFLLLELSHYTAALRTADFSLLYYLWAENLVTYDMNFFERLVQKCLSLKVFTPGCLKI